MEPMEWKSENINTQNITITVWPRTVHVAANISDVEGLILNQYNEQDYKLVFTLDEDSMKTHWVFR